MIKKLTVKQERFAQEYVSLGNASAAYRLVYDTSTMTDEAVHVCASRLKAKVWLRIKELQLVEAEQYKISRSEVLNLWMQIATADVNDVIQIRKKACVHCYEGKNSKKPNEKCENCFGEGESCVYIADTRSLAGSARILYAGARKTRDGVEVILRNQDAALVNLARTLNMFNQPEDMAEDKKSVVDVFKKITDPLEAAKIYEEIMSG